jgi:hypothetical protein
VSAGAEGFVDICRSDRLLGDELAETETGITGWKSNSLEDVSNFERDYAFAIGRAIWAH